MTSVGERREFSLPASDTARSQATQALRQSWQAVEDENTEKSCWVCFATEADDRLAAWVHPCKCIGTTRWMQPDTRIAETMESYFTVDSQRAMIKGRENLFMVYAFLVLGILHFETFFEVHQSCLQRWVDEKQRGNITRKVLCPQCKAEYIVVFPSMGAFVALLDAVEDMTHKLSPFIAGGVLLGSIYWIAITYGAVTVMQVVGHREGLEMMESADPLVLLVLLPTIPVTLISAKMYNWEDSVLLFLRKYCAKIPALSYILPFGNTTENSEGRSAVVAGPLPHLQPMTSSSHLSPTRIFCSALLLPTISTIMGKIFFRSIQNNLHRSILGGLTYITIKGAMKIYHKQMLYIRHSSRKILDYTESNLRLYKDVATSISDAMTSTRDDSEQVV